MQPDRQQQAAAAFDALPIVDSTTLGGDGKGGGASRKRMREQHPLQSAKVEMYLANHPFIGRMHHIVSNPLSSSSSAGTDGANAGDSAVVGGDVGGEEMSVVKPQIVDGLVKQLRDSNEEIEDGTHPLRRGRITEEAKKVLVTGLAHLMATAVQSATKFTLAKTSTPSSTTVASTGQRAPVTLRSLGALRALRNVTLLNHSHRHSGKACSALQLWRERQQSTTGNTSVSNLDRLTEAASLMLQMSLATLTPITTASNDRHMAQDEEDVEKTGSSMTFHSYPVIVEAPAMAVALPHPRNQTLNQSKLADGNRMKEEEEVCSFLNHGVEVTLS